MTTCCMTTRILCCLVIIFGNLYTSPYCLANHTSNPVKFSKCQSAKKFQLPQDLISNGLPLDAYVMMHLTTDFNKIFDLMREKEGTIEERVDLTLEHATRDNKFGYWFSSKDCKEHSITDFERQGYCFWKYLKTVKNVHLIEMYSWMGQNGEWSEMFFIERQGEFVRKTKTLFSGDRSTDGFLRTYFENGDLYIMQNATSYKVFMRSIKYLDELDIGTSHITYKGIVIPREIYKDLYDSTCDSVGYILFRLQDDQVDLVNITLSEITHVPCSSLQNCFDKVAKKYLESNAARLNPVKMKQFAQDVLDMYIQKSKLDI